MPTSRGGRQVYQNLAWRLAVCRVYCYLFVSKYGHRLDKGFSARLKGSRRHEILLGSHDLDRITTSRVLQQCR